MDELARMDSELEQIAAMQRQGPRASPPLPATFSLEAIYDDAASTEQGKPVYRDVEMVTIKVGAVDNVRHQVTDEDRRTYAAQYLAWKKSEGADPGVDGFPLAQWAMIPGKAVVKAFATYDIRSVEQLAALTDSTLERIGPYKQLRQHARDWVAEAQKQAPLTKLRTENDELRSRVTALEQILAERPKDGAAVVAPDPRLAALEAQIAALAAQMKAPAEQVLAPPSSGAVAPAKRRGRPPGSKNKPKDPATPEV